MLRTIPTIFLIQCVMNEATADTTLRVMSFNKWVGGAAGRQPLSQTVKVINSEVVGENERNADIMVAPWPSDHRAVEPPL